MLNGFWKLTWVEIKIFLREPMGAFGSLGFPVVLFLLLGRVFSARAGDSVSLPPNLAERPAIFASIFIALSAVTSLTAIIAIYREGGILKRLRATPLRPVTILGAHVMVKLLLTAAALGLLLLAGKRYYPAAFGGNLLSFAVALLLSTLSIVSIGFVIASVVRTARFARPLSGAILFPMLGISGLFMPIDALPAPWGMLATVLPTTHAVSLLRGIWVGAPWSQHYVEVSALILNFGLCSALSAKVFRWE
ncbi:MAG: ABC transporter permease [Acidobacteria bacterium]|nr:ABC transporter permease [Acidobacteriota bacterium]